MKIWTLSVDADGLNDLRASDLGTEQRYMDHDLLCGGASLVDGLQGTPQVTQSCLVLRQETMDKVHLCPPQYIHQCVLKMQVLCLSYSLITVDYLCYFLKC